MSDIFVAQAEEEIEGCYPPRVEVSKSSRKPIALAYPKARATFGVGYIGDRPKAAAIIARAITSWADIEVQCARLLGELMGTATPAAAAVFGSLRSSRAQHDAMEAVAKIGLNEQDYELFTAHMNRRASLEKERNDLAHGCYGTSVAIPDAVVWVSQTDFLVLNASHLHDPKAEQNFRAKQFVYELGTLERIAQEIEEFYEQLGFFKGYLYARREAHGDAFRTQRYPQLCSQPHIREALDRVRAAKKASPSQPKAPRGGKRGKR